jgi:hypothetical protein
MYRRVPFKVFFDSITTLFLTYKISEIFSKLRKFHPQNSTRKNYLADLMLYSNSAQFSKASGLFILFCVEMSTQGAEMSKLLHAMVDNSKGVLKERGP